MFVRIDTVTPAANSVVSVGLARKMTRIDQTSDDSLLQLFIHSATASCENYLNRALITRTLRFTWSETHPPATWPYVTTSAAILPFGIEYLSSMNRLTMSLPFGPVQAVESVIYGGWDTAPATLDPTAHDYTVDLPSGRISINRDTVPSAWAGNSYFSCTYRAGFGDTPEAVPAPIIHGILLATAQAYEHRGDGETPEIPAAVFNKLSDYRSIQWPVR